MNDPVDYLTDEEKLAMAYAMFVAANRRDVGDEDAHRRHVQLTWEHCCRIQGFLDNELDKVDAAWTVRPATARAVDEAVINHTAPLSEVVYRRRRHLLSQSDSEEAKP
jgi:hypothetical protein